MGGIQDLPLATRTDSAKDRQLPRTGMVILAGTGVLGGALYLLVAFITHLPGPGDSLTDWVKFAQAHSHAAQGELGLWTLTLLMLRTGMRNLLYPFAEMNSKFRVLTGLLAEGGL